MRFPAPLSLIVVMALLPSAAGGQTGLSFERAAGLGLKSHAEAGVPLSDMGFGGAAAHSWQALGANEYALYGGGRDEPRLGLRTTESFAGLVYGAAGWGASFEVAHSPLSPLAAGRYSLTGQLHTSLSEGRVLSVGLKYRIYDQESLRYAAPGDIAYGYTLAGPRLTSYPPSYQLQMSYQYSAAGTVGLAVGRELETFVPFNDPSGSGPRQFSLTGQHWLTPSWGLSYDLSHDLASSFRLQGLRLGVRYRF